MSQPKRTVYSAALRSPTIRKAVWLLGSLAVGAAIAMGCSSPPDDTGGDGILNASGCASADCSSCINGYHQVQLATGERMCSSRETVSPPIVLDFRVTDQETKQSAAVIAPHRLYTIALTAGSPVAPTSALRGAVTVWAQGRLADRNQPPGYLCRLTSVDLSKGELTDSGRTVGVSDAFTVQPRCFDAVKTFEAKRGRLDHVELKFSFDADGAYDVLSGILAVGSQSPPEDSNSPFWSPPPPPRPIPYFAVSTIAPWRELERFVPVSRMAARAAGDYLRTHPDAGVTIASNDAGPIVDDAGQVTLVGDLDEGAYLAQRLLSFDATGIGGIGNYPTLLSSGPFPMLLTLSSDNDWRSRANNVGRWAGDVRPPTTLRPVGLALNLDSAVLRVGPRLARDITDYASAPTATRPNELSGSFSYLTVGAIPENPNFQRASGGRPSLYFYIRPAGGSPSDWVQALTGEGTRIATDNDAFGVPLSNFSAKPGALTFSVRLGNAARQRIFRDWSQNTQFEISACPRFVNKTVYQTPKDDPYYNDTGAYRVVDAPQDPNDSRCARANVAVETTALGNSGQVPVGSSASDGATNAKRAGNSKMGTSQGGTNGSSCQPDNTGKTQCTTTQGASVATSGAFQANIASASMSVTASVTAGEDGNVVGSKPSPRLEVFGFNLLAGLSGDSIRDGNASVTFPISDWITSYLKKGQRPAPPGGGVSAKPFRPGEKFGLAYTFQKAWPPFCGVYGCVQVIAEAYAGATLGAKVKVSTLGGASGGPVPCVGKTSRCFVAHVAENRTVNKLNYKDASAYCGKLGGRLARIRDANEQALAVKADADAMDAFKKLMPLATGKPWLGFEKTYNLRYDPATCADLIDRGGAFQGECYASGAPNFEFVKQPPPEWHSMGNFGYFTQSEQNFTVAGCRAQCRAYPFFAMYPEFINQSTFVATAMKCGCLDNYGAYGKAPAANCRATCEGASCGDQNAATAYGVFSTLTPGQANQALQACMQGANPAWGYPADNAILQSRSPDGTTWNVGGGFSRLTLGQPSDKYVVLDRSKGDSWRTVSEESTNYPLCEYEPATSANGVAISATLEPAIVGGAAVSVIYGNRYVAGVGVKLEVNFVSLSLPLTTEFSTVRVARNGTTKFYGAASFSGDINVAFLSGSLSAVLYTAFRDFAYPIFEFSGIEKVLPLFKYQKIWKY